MNMLFGENLIREVRKDVSLEVCSGREGGGFYTVRAAITVRPSHEPTEKYISVGLSHQSAMIVSISLLVCGLNGQ
jgi:hypothetical protein